MSLNTYGPLNFTNTPIYEPAFIFRNPHLNTIYPHLFRKVTGIKYTRERLSTPDGDFIDLDFSSVASSKLVIIAHGLESNSNETYVKGMVKSFNKRKWDSVVMNFRGCSGEANLLPRSYHSGATEDLTCVIDYLKAHKNYAEIVLVGFSLGANLILKYLGESGHSIASSIQAAVAVSAPCCLKGSSTKLSKRSNQIYMQRFVTLLKEKMKQKAKTFPGLVNYRDFRSVRSFQEFDDLYTAPFHGFRNAEDYWEQCSSKKYVESIKIPTLLINSLDDPFLNEECFPFKAAALNKNFQLETPAYGGHVGFVSLKNKGEYWHETRAANFITNSFQ